MKQPQQLKKTLIAGATVSSIFVPIGTEGGYFETMLFLDGRTIPGLREFETCSIFDSWKDNHRALEQKVLNAVAPLPISAKEEDDEFERRQLEAEDREDRF